MTANLLDEKIGAWARHCPGKTAVKCEERSVSYLELEQKANRIANFMKGKIGAVPHVVVILDRSAQLIESIVGLLKGGLVFVPLDPQFPVGRVEQMIVETGAGWVITLEKYHDRFREILDSGTIQTLFLDEDDERKCDRNHHFYLPADIEADRLTFEKTANKHCYIYFTSGSTGTPKGVLGRLRGLAHFIRWEIDEFGVDENFSVSQLTPPSFDPYLRDIFVPLVAGGTCCIPSRRTLLDIGRLIQWIDSHDITLVHTVPSLFKRLAAAVADDGCWKHLKYILLAGELLRGRDITRFMDIFKSRIQLVNVYGPTETTLAKLFYRIKPEDVKRTIIPVGKPINGAQVLILDNRLKRCRPGKRGEVFIRTPYISAGYYNDPRLTAELFIPNPFGKHDRDILYKTGDRGRQLEDGNIELSGRVDFQVKIRGVRIEMAEIENRLLKHDDIDEVVVTAGEDEGGDKYLCAYMVPVAGKKPLPAGLRRHLAAELPDYMIPSHFVYLERLPLNLNGKLDRTGLPAPGEPVSRLEADYTAPGDALERRIAAIWGEVLKLEKVGVEYNFFDLGGNSLKAMEISSRLSRELNRDIAVTALFEHSTVRTLAAHLAGKKPETAVSETATSGPTGPDIAVIGISCRFPGARNVQEYWENLKEGRETVSFFSMEELVNTGSEAERCRQPNYIRAAGIMPDREWFDPLFFGYTPLEAELLDPQIRIFHECTWEALEDSGIVPESYDGLIGVYAGASQNLGWEIRALLSGKSAAYGEFAASRLTGIRYLCTRLSYNLNLGGPSINIQTACSTSLVAVHLACRALEKGECRAAVAGGVTVSAESNPGYLHEEGMILSPDGHCRPFDTGGGGTIFGEGAGVVVLTPLESAMADGYHVYAVIKGTAVNNDGNRKVGFTAPSVVGQSQVIRTACRQAGIEPESISYVEAHGTGTAMGDPIEIEALSRVFPAGRKQRCRIGSVKSNFGHLDAAAGVAGFIKTVLALSHRLIPASLHFETPNPRIKFADTPFEVNTRPAEWERDGTPLRAGVNSFGMGGTNAHVILEEAAAPEAAESSRSCHLLLLSARTESALKRMIRNLALHFKAHPDIHLADAAFTLQAGRRPFRHRCMLSCGSIGEAAAILSSPGSRKLHRFHAGSTDRPVIFMFSGLGSHYVNMGRHLYSREPHFRQQMDGCFSIVKSLGFDIEATLYPPEDKARPSGFQSVETAQLAMFILEYSMARLLMRWGVYPRAMIGYSFGEYASACLSGVLSLEETLRLIVHRGRLLQTLPAGAMMSIPLSRDELLPLLSGDISVAVDNGPSCVVSGPVDEIDACETRMKHRKLLCMRIDSQRALHSKMMEPIVEEFTEAAAGLQLKEPGIPYISNVTGTWITGKETADPGYWAMHLCRTVRFDQGIKELAGITGACFVEIGPGRDLTAMVRRHIEDNPEQKTLNLVRPRDQDTEDDYLLLNGVGRLWLWGVTVDWRQFHSIESRRRISLPPYPFERQRYWIDGDPFAAVAGSFMKTGPPAEIPVQETADEPPTVTSPRPDIETEYIPPGTEAEKRLAAMWSRLFGLEEIGIDDDFYEIGGDSLKAMMIITTISREQGVDIALNDFTRNATVRKLVRLISLKHPQARQVMNLFGESLGLDTARRDEQGVKFLEEELKKYVDQPGVPLNSEEENRRRLFCFPPSFGFAMVYQDLAKLIKEWTVYSFNFIEEENRISRYIDIIKSRQPLGPYYLFEYSAGARLTFQVAAALERQGETVADIILVDSLWPRDNHDPEVHRSVIRGIEEYLEKQGADFLKGKILRKVRKYRRYFTDQSPPEKVKARIHLILSEENKDTPLALCWQPFTTKKVRLHQGCGSHDEMMTAGMVERNAEIIGNILTPKE